MNIAAAGAALHGVDPARRDEQVVPVETLEQVVSRAEDSVAEGVVAGGTLDEHENPPYRTKPERSQPRASRLA